MKRTTIATCILFCAITLFLSSCSEDIVNDPVNEEELITDIIITMVNTLDASDTATFTYLDPDGDAGSAVPVISGDSLRLGTNYSCMIALYDKSKSPIDTISTEIEEEANSHRFDYVLEGDAAEKATFTITDKDDNNLPVGLAFTTSISTGSSVNGTLRVVLNHFDKVVKGFDNKDETDIDIMFPITLY